VNAKKIFGLAAIAGLLFIAAPTQQANAVSLNNPAVAATVNGAGEGLTTEVQYRHHRGHYRHHYGFRRHHGWHRPHVVRRHHGWHRHHHHHRRHWR
jgi:hypothetical protein